MGKQIETEIKIELKDIDLILDLLKKKAVFEGKTFQRTIRMDTPNMDLEKKKIFLRVRSGFKNIVTLKINKKKTDKFFQRDEYETEVKDVNLLSEIFSLLGFNKKLVMEKYRAIFKYQETTLCLDELPFGIFLEIEGKEDDITKVIKELNLGLEKKIIVSYWDLFTKYKKENNILDQKNIIFPEGYKSKFEGEIYERT